ncbi:MAG: hypothetical protein IIC79_05310 [Chloroflexi bacterium]|nr:hypothetical protein [Chloroflexota bacterium]
MSSLNVLSTLRMQVLCQPEGAYFASSTRWLRNCQDERGRILSFWTGRVDGVDGVVEVGQKKNY